ncbi:MAG: hypothetical protein HY650_01550 [Acidobacteria bacterium]|nr:hypothetical protein [Acidobacteriota bacterium]
MRYNEPAPGCVDIISVREPKNRTLDTSNNPVRQGWSKSESIICERSRANSPELDEVLRRNGYAIPGFAKPGYRVTSLEVLRVLAMKPPKDDVGVGENFHHYRFQSSSRV